MVVDRCRVWESHADADGRRIVKPTPERARPLYTVNEPACMLADQVMAAVTMPSVGLGDLEASLRHLLPTAPVQAPQPRPVPTEMEIMPECLPPNVPAPAPAPMPRTAITDTETMLQSLLPGTPTRALRSRPVTAHRDWATIVCFSCGKPGHGLGKCPQLDETFPYMLPGWSVEKVAANYIIISPRVTAECLRAGNGD